MSKFNKVPDAPTMTAPVKTSQTQTRTYEGGAALERKPKSDLFLLMLTNMVGEDTFYESAGDRDARFKKLIHKVTKKDPEWVAGLIPYARNKMFMRSAPLVAAAEYVKAGGPNGRAVVRSALQRADEPAEILSYWRAAYGRQIPMALRRGVADAVGYLYTPFNALKYDGKGNAMRFGDVINIVHPAPADSNQSLVFQWLLDRRHHSDNIRVNIDNIPVLKSNRDMQETPVEGRRELLRIGGPDLLNAAGMTWESLSGWLPGGMDKDAWEAMIPSMGAMALVRNLRNFDQAKVGKEAAKVVTARLTDAEAIARSKMFPFRMYTAFKNTDSVRWAQALEEALDLACQNIPALGGKTLVLVDLSGSMSTTLSARSSVSRWEAGAVFGAALASKTDNVDLVAFGTSSAEVKVASSTLKTVENVSNMARRGTVGHGTAIWQAANKHYNGHDRVVVFTDEQSADSAAGNVLRAPFIYLFNLAGYAQSTLGTGKDGRYTLGGFSDSTFTLMSILENWTSASWPWESA